MQKGKFRVSTDYATFWCPGCESGHTIKVSGPHSWQFDFNYDQPTIQPSILLIGTQDLTEEEYQRVMAGEVIEPKPRVCHSYITNGQIRFWTDCTHKLNGQTVDLPDLPDYLKD